MAICLKQMITLTDYQISAQIHQSSNSLVYRGYREADNLPVIIKILRENYPTPTQLTRYKQEYQLTRNLELEGVVKAYDLIAYQNTLAIIFEDFGGDSLKIISQSEKFTLTELLNISIKICDGLSQLHSANIIHKDINPANIVYNNKTEQLKIIDLGISTQLSQEIQTLKNPDLLEGTLAYISPEQTGRVNRPIDSRSDLYSLGVTLYELLTKQLPFTTQDSLELVYCHLAKEPIAPHEVNISLPQIISDIVMKLMAKNPDASYQTAWGLKADLENCLRQLETTGIITSFPLGNEDITNSFSIPNKLYGREEEVETLLTIFKRINTAQQSNKELVLVSGYSGIGKSALVKEIYQPITETKGYFLSGKFEQYQKNIPYYGIILAFKQLIEQLLTESLAKLKQWQDKIQSALKANGRVIIDVIPELELIIGKQPEIPDLGAQEAQNRFNLVFQDFVRVFCQPEHPLVLFLDDLQWADVASLKLLQVLAATSEIANLLITGAYRNNEVNQVHPLMLTIADLKEAGVKINEIVLSPLKLAEIELLVTESVNTNENRIQPLVELLKNKTNGNPFFIREFLKSLYEEKLLLFDRATLTWTWDIKEIQARQITDNVVDLMVNKIQKLPTQTQSILKLAACIGNKFNIETLKNISHRPIREVALDLHEALAAGLILPLNDNYKAIELDAISEDLDRVAQQVNYKFVHDRIQQAAYSLILEVNKEATHLEIGRVLLQNMPSERLAKNIFELVNQFNRAINLVGNNSESDKIAELNLIAARQAKNTGAYDSGLEYINLALELLGKDSWQRQYQLSLELHQIGAELASFCGRDSLMEELITNAIARANSVLDKVNLDRIKIRAKAAQNQLSEALNISLELLADLGIIFPKNPTQDDVGKAIEEINRLIGNREISELIYLPKMVDSQKIAIVEIVNSTFSSAYNSNPLLFPLLVALSVKLSIQYGNNASTSAFSYACYGSLACNFLKDINSGVAFGKLAYNLASQSEVKTSIPEVLFTIGMFFRHREKHLKETIEVAQNGYLTSLEVGNLFYVGYCAHLLSLNSFWCAQPLMTLDQQIQGYLEISKQKNLSFINKWCHLYRQVVLSLLGKTKHPYLLEDGMLQESASSLTVTSPEDSSRVFFFHLFKLMLCYLFEDLCMSQSQAAECRKYLLGGIGTITEVEFYFYDSLVALAEPDLLLEENPEVLSRIEANQKQLKEYWADYAPMNHQHKYLLVEAEKYRVLGDRSTAIDYYDKAIKLAHENEYLNEEALAYELAAKFCLARENELFASVYMKQARYCYLKWGANAKVEHLNHKYPELLATVTSELDPLDTISTSASTKGETLDLETLLRTSKALAQIDDFRELLQTLIKFVLENAGAEKGYLILVQSDNLIIQALGTTEEIITLQALPLDNCQSISQTVVNYVCRTQESVVLDNAYSEGLFIKDSYIQENQIRSLLCLPILNQGRIISILYLENNLAENSFTANRLELLKLISSQAAISIENVLLRQQEAEETFEYQVGGCLTINSPTYVIRQADIDLYSSLKKGDYCYVLNSRHMGKSSLRVRIMHKLQLEGTICAFVDLTSIGSKNISPEQWYAGVIYSLVNSLKLNTKFNFRSWWRELDLLSPAQKFSEFIREIVLREIRGKIVIFIDEIDSTLGLNFNLDDFFAVIRACYNFRSDNEDYQRISFVLLGVASPASLVRDKNCTPFNIGRAISLDSFQLHEVKPLIKGLAVKTNNPQLLIDRVLYWTGGQPFLTQKICSLIAEEKDIIPEGKEVEWIDNSIQSKVISDWKSHDDPQHLQTISDRLTKSDSATVLLEIYRRILEEGAITIDYSKEQKELLLSGLVKQDREMLVIYNSIYKFVFNIGWLNDTSNLSK